MNFMESSLAMSRKSFSLKDRIQRKSGTRYCSRWSGPHVPSIKYMYVFALLALAMISTVHGSDQGDDSESSVESSVWKTFSEGKARYLARGRKNRKQANWKTFFFQSKTFWFTLFTILSMIAVSFLGNGDGAADGAVRASSVLKNFCFGIGGVTLLAIGVGFYFRQGQFRKWKKSDEYEQNPTIQAWEEHKQKEMESSTFCKVLNFANRPLCKSIALCLAGALLIIIAFSTTSNVGGEWSNGLKFMTWGPAAVLLVAGMTGLVMTAVNRNKPEDEKISIVGWVSKLAEEKTGVYVTICVALVLFACCFNFGDDAHMIWNEDGGSSLFARLMIILPCVMFMGSRIYLVNSASVNAQENYEMFKSVTYAVISFVGLITLFCAGSIGGVAGTSLSMFVSIACVFLGGYGFAKHFGNLLDLKCPEPEKTEITTDVKAAAPLPSDVQTSPQTPTSEPSHSESDGKSQEASQRVLPVNSTLTNADGTNQSIDIRRRLVALERLVDASL